MKDSLEEAAATFRALGHPKRLAIVEWLLEQHAAYCSGDPGTCEMKPTTCDFVELVDRLGVTKATISHHVNTLADAGIIDCERRGRSLCCTVNRDRLRLIQEVFSLSVVG